MLLGSVWLLKTLKSKMSISTEIPVGIIKCVLTYETCLKIILYVTQQNIYFLL